MLVGVLVVPVHDTRALAHAGFVQRRGEHGVWRVQGELAVTRSIGDIPLQHYLSSLADVVVVPMDDREATRTLTLEFVVVASDGVWDVVDNADAVQLVARHLRVCVAGGAAAANASSATAVRRTAPSGSGLTHPPPARGGGASGPAPAAAIDGSVSTGNMLSSRLGVADAHTPESESLPTLLPSTATATATATAVWAACAQEAAQALSWEAFVRGGADNIGVFVIPFW